MTEHCRESIKSIVLDRIILSSASWLHVLYQIKIKSLQLNVFHFFGTSFTDDDYALEMMGGQIMDHFGGIGDIFRVLDLHSFIRTFVLCTLSGNTTQVLSWSAIARTLRCTDISEKSLGDDRPPARHNQIRYS